MLRRSVGAAKPLASRQQHATVPIRSSHLQASGEGDIRYVKIFTPRVGRVQRTHTQLSTKGMSGKVFTGDIPSRS